MSNSTPAETSPSAKADYSGETVIKMPKSLHRKLAEAAAREGVDFFQYLVTLLSEKNALRGMGDVQTQLTEINQQLQPEGTAERFRIMREKDQNARSRRMAYNNRYIEDWESGLND